METLVIEIKMLCNLAKKLQSTLLLWELVISGKGIYEQQATLVMVNKRQNDSYEILQSSKKISFIGKL